MKFVYLYIFVFFSSCKSNESSENLSISKYEVSEYEIYEVINFVLKEMRVTDSLEGNQFKYLVNKPLKPSCITNIPNQNKIINRYFSISDLIFINKQLNIRENFRIEQNKIVEKTIISKDTLETLVDNYSQNRSDDYLHNYNSRFEKNYYYEFSLPVFSKNKKIVLLEISSLFGGGYSMILTKKNNTWKSKIINIWSN